MLQFEELRLKLQDMEPELRELKQSLNIDKLGIEIAELERKAAEPSFWDDMENSQKVLQRTSQLKASVETYNKLQSLYEDTLTLIELAEEAGDESVYEEAAADTEQLQTRMAEVRLTTLLTGEYDSKNAILTFHAGAGGTEAQDWAQMLYRMYTRWAERHGYAYKILDYLDGDEAGIKSASILIEGMNAYGFLKSENGVHRLVRVSPFDASGRRQTSFASLEVMPEIDKDVNIEIREEDIQMDVYRASGAGGQVAMNMLRSKLVEIKEREHLDKIEDIKGVQKEIAWGSQIRSYVFMPYTMVKDHRTNYETGNITAVMDGDLDGFINEYLKKKSQGTLEK